MMFGLCYFISLLSPIQFATFLGQCPGKWHCVGTQVACPLNDDGRWPHWIDKYPTTNGGKPHWKTMIRKPAERLVELLENHGIEKHCPHLSQPAWLMGESDVRQDSLFQLVQQRKSGQSALAKLRLA